MGLFNRLGRGVEKFKQDAMDAAEETKGTRCPACDATFDIDTEQDRHECPECGATLETTADED